MGNHGLMIDMDGVIYAGEELIEGGDVFVQRLLKEKINFTFLSNNSSRSRRDAVDKLAKLGITGVTEEHINTSAMATATCLREEFPNCTAYVLGEGGLLKSLENHGIKLVEKDPDFVILGEGIEFDLTLLKSMAYSAPDENFLDKLNSVIINHIQDSELDVEDVANFSNMSKPTLYR